MTDIIQYEGIENLGTTTDLINGKPIYDLDRVIETSGFTTAGDGGAGKWKQNGITGQTPSQTPAQLGDALINDANGNQWAFIGATINILQTGGDIQAAINGVNISIVCGDLNTVVNTPAFTLPSNKELKQLNIKYSGSGGENFITLDSDVNNSKIHQCVIDGNNLANQAIRGNGGVNCSIHKNTITNTLSNGIQITKGVINDNFNIEKNVIKNTVGANIELRGFFNSSIDNNNLSLWGSGKNAIQLQDLSENISICSNKITSTGDLFGIESAGSTAKVLNSRICDNIMTGEFTGISGKYSDSTISGNVFTGGQNGHRSGIETLGSNLLIENNKIDKGAISVASNGDNTPKINANNITISNNLIKNSGTKSAIEVGAVSTFTGTPTSLNLDIKNNIIDMTEATGSSLRCLLIGQYGAQSVIDNINIQNNTLIGDEQTSSEGIRFNSLTGSGTVNIKLNTIKGLNKAIRLNNDNLANAYIKFNDISQEVSIPLSDASTTTNVIFTENEI